MRSSGGPGRVLCCNAGSSSLKAALYRRGDGPPERLVAALVERVGTDASTITVTRPGGERHDPQPVDARDHVTALDAVATALADVGHDLDATPTGHPPADDPPRLVAVAHRLVHGGPDLVDHTVIDDAVRRRLDEAVPFAPLHLPAELALVDAATRRFPHATPIGCLDTAFHRGLRPEVRRLPVPAALDEAGVRRYGFHGLSYEYLVHRLGPDLGRRAVLAHLGNGASLAAVLDCRGVDTTMGFTPTGGLVMGSRTGDIDPGVLLYVGRGGADVAALEALVDRQSGLLGVSGRSGDVRDLLAARADGDAAAALALAVYVTSAAKHVAALTTMLGGLDTLVFTAGVGEHAAPVRAEVAVRLAHLGVEVDPTRNADGAAVISPDGAAVTVRVEPTDEELIMAGHALRLAPRSG